MVNRRRVLGSFVRAIVGGITGALGIVLGGAALPRAKAAVPEHWYDAGALASLSEGQPREAAVRLERHDGYYTTIDRRVVYLVRSGDAVRAFSPMCTHLGCRVAWHPGEGLFKCPCHGGQYGLDGRVVSGPPPRGLDEIPIRVDGARVMVQLL